MQFLKICIPRCKLSTKYLGVVLWRGRGGQSFQKQCFAGTSTKSTFARYVGGHIDCGEVLMKSKAKQKQEKVLMSVD